jgi:hypothetical protein
VSDKPVLVVEVDDSQFDAFLDKYAQYAEAVKTTPDAWKDTSTAVKQVSTGFEGAYNEFNKLNSLVVGPQWGKSLSNFNQIGVSSLKSWSSIRKEIEASGKGMSLLGRLAIGLGSLGGIAIAAGAGIAGTVLGSVPGVAKSLSDENRVNHELGLTPGENEAFKDQYGTTLGVSTADLSKIADIKANPARWTDLVNATRGGVGIEDIKHLDPVDLWAKAAQKAGEAYKAMGVNGGQWAQDQGANDLFGAGTVRNASQRDNDWWNQQHQQYSEERDKLNIGQPKLDAATAFEQKWQSDLSVLKRDFELAITPLEPIFIKMANGATKIIDSFAKSPDLEKNIDKTIDAFENFYKEVSGAIKWLDDHLPSSATPSIGKGGDKLDDAAIDAGKEAASLLSNKSAWDKLINAVLHPAPVVAGSAPKNAAWDWKHPFGIFHHDEPATPGVAAPTSAPSNGTDPRHNPGNLRKPGSKTEFQKFASDAEGVIGMHEQIARNILRDHLDTPSKLINKYAPASENDVPAYLKDIEKRTGLKADDHIDWTDLRTQAKLQSAMIQHESPNHKDLTPDAVFNMLGGKGTFAEQVASVPEPKGARDDGNKPIDATPARPVSGAMLPVHFAMPTQNINVTVPAGSNVFQNGAMVQ